MREVLLIVGANVALVAWGFYQHFKRDRQEAREKFAAIVRKWDESQRAKGHAIAEIRYRPVRWGLWLECHATWRDKDGNAYTGKATL